MENLDSVIKEEILRKCRKKGSLASYKEAEDDGDAEEIAEAALHNFEETDENFLEESRSFQDVLAEKRRKYSPKEDFIFLFYNDMIKYIVTKWDGTILRKKSKKEIAADSSEEEVFEEDARAEDIAEIKCDGDANGSKERDTDFTGSWRLSLPDEFADITFVNKNAYSGRISRKMMEGEGVYRWNNGVQYKGDFENNRIEGKGLIEWTNDCWYEGDLVDGYRHGKGTLVDRDNFYMYTGQWHMGHRHGNGYCRYGNNSSYDGDWKMDKMDGFGLRIYSSGARYVGNWRNGVRHGMGTMSWTNGDVYRGDWKFGQMDGQGKYVWNGFLNKTLSWPREASYVGDWRHGTRHGKGTLKTNSMGATKYSGYWKNDKKHGCGMIIGNNGETIEGDPLFLNDIPASANEDASTKIEVNLKNTEERLETLEKEIPPFAEKSVEITKAPTVAPILKPEQFPDLSPYISQLLERKTEQPVSLRYSPSGKCYACEDEKSCSCLVSYTTEGTLENKKSSSRKMNTSGNSLENTDLSDDWEFEDRWLRNCLTMHMHRLRQIYDDYAKLFATTAPKCNLVMSRLCLWQLWRDCGVNRVLGLAEIDDCMVDPGDPFETIEIWQFLHALIQVSWHFYTRNDEGETKEIYGKLAGGLHKLLTIDIYPNAGNHVGNLCQAYRDLLPISCVFELYRETGYPLPARNLLRAMCIPKETPGSQSTASVPQHMLNGINSVTVGEKISYLPKSQEILLQPEPAAALENSKDLRVRGLLAFREMSVQKIVEIMSATCPLIKDADSGAIINMDYKLTFIEFYEIILIAAKELLLFKKLEKEMLKTKIEEEIASLKAANSQSEKSSRSVTRSLAQKGSKSRRKLVG